MKIGILAYQSAINFGANLQLVSTYGYLKNHGSSPVIINYIPEDLQESYSSYPAEQAKAHSDFMTRYASLTRVCKSAEQIAAVIKDEGIEGVIIGSDAVAQHHPLMERLRFPTRHVFYVAHLTSDRMFPNPFWGTFGKYLPKGFPMAVISASCQDSSYHWISPFVLKKMKNHLERMTFVSARDTWTREMYRHIYHDKKDFLVTPDPVFSFNQNVEGIPSEKEIREKYDLKKPYFLISFLNSTTVNPSWIGKFEQVANGEGMDCVALPFPTGVMFHNNLKKSIELPLSPIDWYCLIKYSCGYVGHNMHPIVVSLHNSTPFFAFDNYGRRINKQRDDSTSKIRHILSKAELLDYRVSCCNGLPTPPDPEMVVSKLIEFDREKCARFSKEQAYAYDQMLQQVLESFHRI